jgi:hypothetical protein
MKIIKSLKINRKNNIIIIILIMKTSLLVIAALFAVAKADSPDCPESTQVFSYSERHPASAGFV